MEEKNKIYCGDSLELMRELDDNSIDLVITSPPYADLKKYIDFDGIHPDKYVEWFIPYCKEIERIIKPTGSFLLNINDKVQNKVRHPYVFDLISELHKQTGLKMYERLFWNKLKSLPNRARFGDRVEYIFWFVKDEKSFKFNLDEMRVPYSEKSIKRMTKPLKKRYSRSLETDDNDFKSWSPNEKGALPTTLVNISSETKRISDKHVAVYPVELVDYFIKGSTDKGDLVLDPFMGVGTTGLACKGLGRDYIGFEMQQEYIDVSNNRIENG
jgi:DNA modification methylase